MTKTISAYEARTNFGEILNQVYYQGEQIVVTKTGKPMVRIIKADKEPTKTVDDLWQQMRKIAKMGRQNINLVEFIRKDRDSGHKIHP